MIEVNILGKWRQMSVDQARRMAEFYKDYLGEDGADEMIHGATVRELMEDRSAE